MTVQVWEEGEKVLLVISSIHRSARCEVEHVHKVYKNGRFVLTAGGDQYRANGSRTGSNGRFTPAPRVIKYDLAKHVEILRQGLSHSLQFKIREIGDKMRMTSIRDIAESVEYLRDFQRKVYDLECLARRLVQAQELEDVEAIAKELNA